MFTFGRLTIIFSEFITRLEIVMGGKIVEKTIIVGALPIFEALELNLARLLLFCDVDFFSRVGNIAGIDRIEDIKLQSPNDISGVFDVT